MSGALVQRVVVLVDGDARWHDLLCFFLLLRQEASLSLLALRCFAIGNI